MVSAYVHILVWAFIVVPAVLGGWFGWRFGTRGLYVRSIGADIGNEEMSRSLLMRRRAMRIAWAAFGAVIGAVVGALFLMGLARAR
jgi:hypothetical protein